MHQDFCSLQRGPSPDAKVSCTEVNQPSSHVGMTGTLVTSGSCLLVRLPAFTRGLEGGSSRPCRLHFSAAQGAPSIQIMLLN